MKTSLCQCVFESVVSKELVSIYINSLLVIKVSTCFALGKRRAESRSKIPVSGKESCAVVFLQ